MRQKAFFFNTLFPSLLFHFQCVFCYVFLSHLRNTARKHNSEQNRHGFNIPLQSIMASSGRNEIKSFRIVSHRRKNPMTIFHGFFFRKDVSFVLRSVDRCTLLVHYAAHCSGRYACAKFTVCISVRVTIVFFL